MPVRHPLYKYYNIVRNNIEESWSAIVRSVKMDVVKKNIENSRKKTERLAEDDTRNITGAANLTSYRKGL